MTNVAGLIDEACASGISLEARVWISDPSKLPSELRQALRKNQSEVVRLLVAKLTSTPQPSDPGNPLAEVYDEPDERDAIQNEPAYATRQSIPQAHMVTGLLKAARWPR